MQRGRMALMVWRAWERVSFESGCGGKFVNWKWRCIARIQWGGLALLARIDDRTATDTEWRLRSTAQVYEDLNGSMNRENGPLVTEYCSRLSLINSQLSLVNSQLKFTTPGKLPIILEDSSIYLMLVKENQKITTCNQLDLEALGFWVIMTNNLVTHWDNSHYASTWLWSFMSKFHSWS
jgi:hypothetical protein